MDTEVFFGVERGGELEDTAKHTKHLQPEEEQRAKEICANCPVQEECREWALTRFIDYGVWGGMSHRDRLAWWRDYGGRRQLRNLSNFITI